MLVRARNNKQALWGVDLLDQEGLKYDYLSVGYGSFDWMIILFRLLGRKCVRIWVGTDVLKTILFWDYRWKAKILNLFSDNVTGAPWLVCELGFSNIKAKGVYNRDYSCAIAKIGS